MASQLSQSKWVRVALTAIVVFIASFLAITIIVTGYASILAFQARGAPDQELINAFANQYAPWIGPISLILFTFLGAQHVARRVDTAVEPNGIALGVLTSLIDIIVEGARSFGVASLLTVLLTIGAAWLGSRSVQKMTRSTMHSADLQVLFSA